MLSRSLVLTYSLCSAAFGQATMRTGPTGSASYVTVPNQAVVRCTYYQPVRHNQVGTATNFTYYPYYQAAGTGTTSAAGTWQRWETYADGQPLEGDAARDAMPWRWYLARSDTERWFLLPQWSETTGSEYSTLYSGQGVSNLTSSASAVSANIGMGSANGDFVVPLYASSSGGLSFIGSGGEQGFVRYWLQSWIRGDNFPAWGGSHLQWFPAQNTGTWSAQIRSNAPSRNAIRPTQPACRVEVSADGKTISVYVHPMYYTYLQIDTSSGLPMTVAPRRGREAEVLNYSLEFLWQRWQIFEGESPFNQQLGGGNNADVVAAINSFKDAMVDPSGSIPNSPVSTDLQVHNIGDEDLLKSPMAKVDEDRANFLDVTPSVVPELSLNGAGRTGNVYTFTVPTIDLAMGGQNYSQQPFALQVDLNPFMGVIAVIKVVMLAMGALGAYMWCFEEIRRY